MAEIARSKPITKAQIKSIHVALSRHGIDDDTYRAKLDGMFGVSSCKQLSRRDASALLKSLGHKLQNQPGHYPPHRHSRVGADLRVCPNTDERHNRGEHTGSPLHRVVSLPSPAQRQFIADLVGEITWRVKDGYPHWLKKNMGLTQVATAQQAARVIEGLKALKAHQSKR